jgi:NAD(P)-dependent dehydrogenase (short-subunit alcohol dehydrogenase family)
MASPTIQDLFDLKGKIALVTGGARNLGFDMATALAEAGAEVAITSRNLESARKAARQIARDIGRRVVGFACDARYEDQVEKMVSDVLKEFGKIDILVCNTGNVVSTPENKPIEQRLLADASAPADSGVARTRRSIAV